jgi:hypothetical protein
MMLQLFHLFFSKIFWFSNIQTDLQTIEPSILVRIHIIWGHVVIGMLDSVMMPNFAPVVNSNLVIREVHIMGWVDFQELIDFIL